MRTDLGFTADTRLYRPRHVKTCPREYADSEGPDQPVHLRRLIRAMSVRKQNHWIECFDGEQRPG